MKFTERFYLGSLKLIITEMKVSVFYKFYKFTKFSNKQKNDNNNKKKKMEDFLNETIAEASYSRIYKNSIRDKNEDSKIIKDLHGKIKDENSKLKKEDEKKEEQTSTQINELTEIIQKTHGYSKEFFELSQQINEKQIEIESKQRIINKLKDLYTERHANMIAICEQRKKQDEEFKDNLQRRLLKETGKYQ